MPDVQFAGRHQGPVLHLTNLAPLWDRLYGNLHIANCLAALQRLIVQCLTALQMDNSRSGLLSRAHPQKSHTHPVLAGPRDGWRAQHILTVRMFWVDAAWTTHTHTKTESAGGKETPSIVGWRRLSQPFSFCVSRVTCNLVPLRTAECLTVVLWEPLSLTLTACVRILFNSWQLNCPFKL